MKTRIIAGVSAALIVIGLVFRGPDWLVLMVILFCATISYLEFDRLFFQPTERRRQWRMIPIILLTIVASAQSEMLGWLCFWFSFIFTCVSHIFNSNRSGDFQRDTRDLSLEFLGYVYIVALFGFMMPILKSPGGRPHLFLLFLIVFFGDTAAYFVGMRFGKRKLAAKLSPKKTLEGSVAAIVTSVVVALIWFYFFGENSSPEISSPEYSSPKYSSIETLVKLLVFAPIGSILAQAGDLFESLFKRSQAQKDSGHFLPGHGGILDRIDGLALISPVYYMFLKFILGNA